MAMPGGELLFGQGGYLDIRHYTSLGGTSAGPTLSDEEYLDVAYWQVFRTLITKENAYSGSYGAITRRIVAEDWYAKCVIWYDLENPGVSLLRKGNSVNLTFWMDWGDNYYPDISDIIHPNEIIQAPAEVYNPRLKSPDCLVHGVQTLHSSEGENVVIQEILIEGNSLLFELAKLDDERLYNSYLESLSSTRRLVVGQKLNNINNPKGAL